MDEFQRSIRSPSRSVGISNVLLYLSAGRTTPKDIAETMGVKPPTVIEYLHKLRKLGVVRLSKKIGKHQHYEINWGKFCKFFLSQGDPSLFMPPALYVILGSRRRPLVEKKFSELCKNKLFHELVSRYLREIVNRHEALLSSLGKEKSKRRKLNYSLSEVFMKFENALLYVELPEKAENSELQQLLDCLREWKELLLFKVDPLTSAAVWALRESAGAFPITKKPALFEFPKREPEEKE